jgi:site-specific recombinase XerD
VQPLGSFERDLRHLVVPDAGGLLETGDVWEPYRLLDWSGERVEPVAAFFRELRAAGRSAATVRSYGMDLLRWWRFMRAAEITAWDRATREDARDFMLWMQLANKPVRAHWRHRDLPPEQISAREPSRDQPVAGTPNPVTGKPSIGPKYAPRTRAHCETVLRSFYDFHLECNSGALLVNPFPLARSSQAPRSGARRGPHTEFRPARSGRYRPKIPKQVPRRIPDEKYAEVFAGLRSHRDRALLALWTSTAARASELLTSTQRDPDPGQQVIGVVRKGSGAYQLLPASAEAFVWLRLAQEEAWSKGVPRGGAEPLWWTLRRPWRPLNYHAARAMFTRVVDLLGANWTLHDLRHTAAYRMANDPEMSLVHVQHILGHVFLSTTQIYLNPSLDELIAAGLAHQARREEQRRNRSSASPTPAYNPASLAVLLGPGRS